MLLVQKRFPISTYFSYDNFVNFALLAIVWANLSGNTKKLRNYDE